MSGDRKRTPIPDPRVEALSAGPGPVTTYTLSPEEIAARYGPPGQVDAAPKKRTAIDIPQNTTADKERRQAMWKQKEEKAMSASPRDGTPVEKVIPTRLEFLKMIASGKSINKVSKELGLNPGVMYFWLNKWGLKGIKPESAKQLLDEMVIDGQVPQGLAAINAVHRDEMAKLDPPAPASAEQVAEVARLKEELLNAVQAANMNSEVATNTQLELVKAIDGNRQLNDELERLRQERDDYKQAAEDLECKLLVVETENVTELAVPRSTRQFRIEAVGGQNLIEDELLAILAYVQAMRGRDLKLELYLGEVKTG